MSIDLGGYPMPFVPKEQDNSSFVNFSILCVQPFGILDIRIRESQETDRSHTIRIVSIVVVDITTTVNIPNIV